MNVVRALFASPAALVAGALAALAVALLLVWSARRRAARAAGLVSPDLAAKARFAAAPSRPAAAAILVVLVALGLGAALARPHWGDTQEHAERRGADVVFVLDTSASMRAADVSPSRFALARQAAQSLVARLGSDRVALVSCEGEAQALVPLTLDAAAVGLFLDAIEPGMGAKPGTSIASGIAAAAELFPPGVGGGRHMVFFSDGEDLEGGIEAAIGRAKAEGITIHTVFVGAASGNGAPVPEVDAAGRTSGYKSDASGQPVLSKPDPALLRRLASETGGSFTQVSSLRTDLEGVARQIDLGARRPMSEVLLTMREERFQIPLGIAVAALGLLLLGVGGGRWSSTKKKEKNRGFLRRSRRAPVAGTAALTLLTTALAFRAAAQSAPVVPVSAAPQQAVPPSSPSQNPPSSSDTAAAATAGNAEAPPGEPPSLPLSKKIFSSPRSSAKKGQKALEEKKTDEALTHFQEEVALDPKDPTGAYNLGTAQSKAGRAPEALASLEKARKEGGRALAADAAFNEGQTLFREKQYDQAAAAFRESLKRRPGDADAAWNYELCVRRADEQKKQQEQQKKDQQQKKDDKKDKKNQPGKDDKQQQQAGNKDDEKRRQDREFEQKANMTRDKAEQLLSAIERSDLEEQKKKIAEQRSRRKVARDW